MTPSTPRTAARLLATTALALSAIGGPPVSTPLGGLAQARQTPAESSAAQPALPGPGNKLRAADPAAWLRLRSPQRSGPRYPRAGWSVRQGQRMARKRRNQARNRRAGRG